MSKDTRRWYWTYKNGVGLHLCNYVHLTIDEAKEKYGKSITCQLAWSEQIDFNTPLLSEFVFE